MMQASKPFSVPASEIDHRLIKIRQIMRQEKIDALLVVQRTDLFYFSGTAQNGVLFIPSEGAPLLFIKKYLPRARSETPLENVIGIRSIKEIPDLIRTIRGHVPDVLGLEFDVLPVRDFNFWRQLLPGHRWVDASTAILTARMLKSKWEIAQLERTAARSGRTFEHMRHILRPGLTEMEFAGLYEAFARRQGHGGHLNVRNYQALGYPWHVLSGKSGGMVGLLDSPASGEGSSAAFPCGAGPKRLEAGEPIMVDLGFVHNGYHMDETRMFAIASMPEKAARACRATIEIHDAVIARCRPGAVSGALFEYAVTLAAELGYADQFLGPPGHKVSFIGHGIGLELIEPPFIAKGKPDLLQAGMTLALEPKMVFEGEFSAGIESVVHVSENGSRLITKIPVETFVC
jgi:Xaa-Pro dipeptidase